MIDPNDLLVTKKRHLSISQLNMLSKCGEQYYQRYGLGNIKPPGIAAIVGRTVDNSVTNNLGCKIKGEPLMSLEQIRDLTGDDYQHLIKSEEIALAPDELVFGKDVALGEGKDKAIRLAKLHATEFAPKIKPTHLQRKIEVILENFPYDLVGYIDIQEGLEAIRDTKTAKKSPPKDVADKEDQLTIYAMMAWRIDGAIVKEVTMDYLIDTAVVKALPFKSKRTITDFQVLLRRVEVAAKALQAGIFVPARETDWWCSEKWCGWHSTCKYVKQSKRPTS